MKKMDRRNLLRLAGLAGLGVAGQTLASNLRPDLAKLQGTEKIGVPTPVPPIADVHCKLTPEAIDGPYYFHGAAIRREISEGKPGLPLRLGIQLVDATWAPTQAGLCFPVQNAIVDIWHADALGVYSNATLKAQGIDTEGQTFCRGAQETDKNGYCEFETIVPGWYLEEKGPPWLPMFARAVHIHAKVYVRNKLLTTQIYFPNAFLSKIYQEAAPYKDTPERVSRKTGEKHPRPQNEDDWIFAQGGPMVDIEKIGDGFMAKAVIGMMR